MNGKKLAEMTEKIYSIVSGADNKQEHQEVTSAIEDWLSEYDGDDSAETLADEFKEYYYN